MPKNRAVKIIKNVIWGIIIGIFCLLFALVLWLAVDKFILKSPVPSAFGYASLTVETGSMSGTIEIGDLVIIKDTGDYEIGDIITFLHEGDTVPTTHRIINYNENGTFVTKGDANNVQDSKGVSSDIILGEVVKVLPKVGLFVEWVKSEGWIYIAAALVIAGVGSFIIKSCFKKEEEEQGAENSADKQTALPAEPTETTDPTEPTPPAEKS